MYSRLFIKKYGIGPKKLYHEAMKGDLSSLFSALGPSLLVDALLDLMETEAEAENYEKAARIRNLLRGFKVGAESIGSECPPNIRKKLEKIKDAKSVENSL